MSGPKRWIDDGAPAPVREILIAGSGEQPGEASAQRTLAALGVAGAIGAGAPGAGAAAAAAGAAKAGSTASAAALAVKWGFVGAVSALAAAGIATSVFSPARSTQNITVPPRVEVRHAEVRARSPSPTQESRTPVVPPPSIAPVPQEPLIGQNIAPPHLGRPRAPAGTTEETSRMLDEVSIIDQARAQAAKGDPAGALAALDAYGTRFKSRRFEPEALYLRMEALGKAGDLPGQRAVAERLLAAFPSSPEAERARAVLSK